MKTYFKYVDIDKQVQRKFGQIIEQIHLEFVNDRSSKYYDIYITYDSPYYHVTANHGKLLIHFFSKELKPVIDSTQAKTHAVFSKSSLIKNKETAYNLYNSILSSKLAKGYLSVDRITDIEFSQIDVKSTFNCRLIDLY